MSKIAVKKAFVADIGRCELCGSKRGLDVHHIIPKVLGGDDTEDNLILLCCGCHGKLTPKGMLTRYGIRNTKLRNRYIELVQRFFSECGDDAEGISVSDVLDIFNKYFCVSSLEKYVLRTEDEEVSEGV